MNDEDYLTEEMREDYQRHNAILEAAMGDYLGDDSDTTGHAEPIDVEAETVRPKGMGFGGMDVVIEQERLKFEAAQDEALMAERQARLDALSTIEQYINGQIWDSGKALDACHDLYQYLRHT